MGPSTPWFSEEDHRIADLKLAAVSEEETRISELLKDSRREAQFAILDVGAFGPGEGAALDALSQAPETAAVPVEDLEQGAALVGEGEDGAAARVFVSLVVTASCWPLKLRCMSQGSTAKKTFKLPKELSMAVDWRVRE